VKHILGQAKNQVKLECRERVFEEGKKLTSDDLKTPLDKIKAEFEAYMAELKPLLGRIEETDRLIDQVVYKLYGLTEEEIKTVKGAS
jgi:hypothetical protein